MPSSGTTIPAGENTLEFPSSRQLLSHNKRDSTALATTRTMIVLAVLEQRLEHSID
jgi:hypothetical protein